MQKKQDNARKSLKQAEKAHKAHHGEVQELESELRNAERKMGEYEDMVSEESQSQGKNLQLAGSQVKEYLKLKEKAGKESARYMSQLDSITREQKSDQDKLDTENRKKYEMESKLKNKGHELEESEKRLDKLSEHIRQSETQLEEQQKIYNDMQGDVGCSKDRITQLQRDLEQCQYELGDARVDKHEDNRRSGHYTHFCLPFDSTKRNSLNCQRATMVNLLQGAHLSNGPTDSKQNFGSGVNILPQIMKLLDLRHSNDALFKDALSFG